MYEIVVKSQAGTEKSIKVINGDLMLEYVSLLKQAVDVKTLYVIDGLTGDLLFEIK